MLYPKLELVQLPTPNHNGKPFSLWSFQLATSKLTRFSLVFHSKSQAKVQEKPVEKEKEGKPLSAALEWLKRELPDRLEPVFRSVDAIFGHSFEDSNVDVAF